MNVSRRRRAALTLATVTAVLVTAASVAAHPAPAQAQGRWMSGDLAAHTVLTDGKNVQSEILSNSMSAVPFGFGLNYFANAEPGGVSKHNAQGLSFLATPSIWRWQSLALYSFPAVQQAREDYPGRLIIQGLQWNAPAHGQVDVGIVGAVNEPVGISNFEYLYDRLDTDTSRAGESIPAVYDTPTPSPSPTETPIIVPAQPFDKDNTTAQGTLDGIASLEDNYADQSYALIAHPSRDLNWSIGDLRALQDAAPDVVSGFEGFPGDQAAAARGGYGNYFDASGNPVSDATTADPARTDLARTYGGADDMVAKVGGVWDALLGEGRHWFVYGNSDYKWWTTQYKDPTNSFVVGASFSDFWPGQYDKTWTYVPSKGYNGLVSAIKSGDSFIANGDLINALNFKAALGKTSRTMGHMLTVKKGQKIVLTIAFKSPSTNNNGDRVRVNHVDLITGNVTGLIDPANPAYASNDSNASAVVEKTFARKQMHLIKGWEVMTVAFKPQSSMYFRLRGTNLAANSGQPDRQRRQPAGRHTDLSDRAEPGPQQDRERHDQHAGSGVGRPLVLQQSDLHPREVAGHRGGRASRAVLPRAACGDEAGPRAPPRRALGAGALRTLTADSRRAHSRRVAFAVGTVEARSESGRGGCDPADARSRRRAAAPPPHRTA